MLGAIGLGLVWGWCLGLWNLRGERKRIFSNILLSLVVTITILCLTYYYFDIFGAIRFAISVLIALLIYLIWLYSLQKQNFR